MTDPFTELGLPARPALEESALRAAHFAASRDTHPDRGGAEGAFLAKQRAFEILRDPALRLEALADLVEGRAPPPKILPPAELFGNVAEAVEDARSACSEPSASSPLASAVRLARLAAARQKLEAAAGAVEAEIASARAELARLDARWPAVPAAELRALAARWRFLRKWQREVEEWRLKVRLLFGENRVHA